LSAGRRAADGDADLRLPTGRSDIGLNGLHSANGGFGRARMQTAAGRYTAVKHGATPG